MRTKLKKYFQIAIICFIFIAENDPKTTKSFQIDGIIIEQTESSML